MSGAAASDTTSATKSPGRVAVIGAGISGLAATHRLLELSAEHDQPLEVTLFEASDRLGGILETRQQDGYLVERSADSFITNKPWGVALCQRLGLAEQLIPTESRYRRSLVLRKGRPVAVPEGFMLLAPAKVWPILASPIFSPWGKLRMGLEYFVPRSKGNADESLASFVRRRFGREALERLVQPLVGGIYTSDPEQLSLQATMPRFLEMEREYRSLMAASRQQARKTADVPAASGARYGLFATPRNGVSQLVEALQKVISKSAHIRTTTAIRSLKLLPTADHQNRWELELANGERAEFDAVVIALRSYQAAQLLQHVDAALANRLDEIEYASSAIVVAGYDLKSFQHPLDAFGLVIPAIEKRRILAVSFSSRKFDGRAPEGKVLLRTFVGGAMQPELLQYDDEKLKQLVREELQQILGLSGEADFALVSRYERAMPQYHLGHQQVVEEIEQRVQKQPGLALAGNAYHGVGIPDCVQSGEQAADTIWQALY